MVYWHKIYKIEESVIKRSIIDKKNLKIYQIIVLQFITNGKIKKNTFWFYDMKEIKLLNNKDKQKKFNDKLR